MGNQRTERLGSEIQRALAQILREDVRDPRASSMVSVLRAEVTPDLDICKVYISVYGNSQEQAQAITALKKAAPFIRALPGAADNYTQTARAQIYIRRFHRIQRSYKRAYR